MYLREERLCGAGENFDAFEWWKSNTLKFKILSRMAKDQSLMPLLLHQLVIHHQLIIHQLLIKLAF